MTKETIEISDEAVEVPTSWAQYARTSFERIHLFVVKPQKQVNTEFFCGFFCNTVKVDPPPIIKEITTETGTQVIKIFTIGEHCSGRAKSELHTIFPESTEITEEIHIVKS